MYRGDSKNQETPSSRPLIRRTPTHRTPGNSHIAHSHWSLWAGPSGRHQCTVARPLRTTGALALLRRASRFRAGCTSNSSTWSPKVCKTMAQTIYLQRAKIDIILHGSLLGARSLLDLHYLVPQYALRPIYTRSVSKTGEGCQEVGGHWGSI